MYQSYIIYFFGVELSRTRYYFKNVLIVKCLNYELKEI